MVNTHSPIETLSSPRLQFREFVYDDWLHIHRWSHDKSQTRYDSTPNLSTTRARNIVNMIVGYQRDDPRFHYYAMLHLPGDIHVIGSIYAAVRDQVNNSVEIGYRISTQYWGHGYATEAAIVMRDFARDYMFANRVYAQVVTANVGSVRVLEKIGMVREEVFPRAILRNGHWLDTAVYVYRPE